MKVSELNFISQSHLAFFFLKDQLSMMTVPVRVFTHILIHEVTLDPLPPS